MFGFGSEQAWTSAWMNGLVSCLGCNGVVLVPSQSLLSHVVDTLGTGRNPPSFTVCSGEMQPSYLQPCVITDADLRQIDMNVVFPTERPIMIIDDSPNWSASWDWLSYLPTFHISCRLLHSAITDRFLRDRTRRCFDPDVEASGLVQRGPCV